jgi:hypothetical protein
MPLVMRHVHCLGPARNMTHIHAIKPNLLAYYTHLRFALAKFLFRDRHAWITKHSPYALILINPLNFLL